MGRVEIRAKIEAALPAARQFIRGSLDNRLRTLASKSNSSGREIRWYRKQDNFCLAHDTRTLVEGENIADEALKAGVSEIFRARALEELGTEATDTIVRAVVDVCHRTLEVTFEKQGLEVAYFVAGEDSQAQIRSGTIAEHAEQATNELALQDRELSAAAKRTALSVLRRTFYDSTPEERVYLEKLSSDVYAAIRAPK